MVESRVGCQYRSLCIENLDFSRKRHCSGLEEQKDPVDR